MNIFGRMNEISGMIREGTENAIVTSIAERYVGFPWVEGLPMVFGYIRGLIRFQVEKNNEDVSLTVEQTLGQGYGDCEDQTILLGSVLTRMGYNVRLKVVGTKPNNFTHIYPVVGIPKLNPTNWLPLDVASKSPIGGEPAWKKVEMVFPL